MKRVAQPAGNIPGASLSHAGIILYALYAAACILAAVRAVEASKNKTACACAAAILVLFAFTGTAAASRDGKPAAELESVRGRVVISRAGNVLWQEADNGTLLYHGDVVKTHSRSSAIIRFIDGGFFKLMPAGKAVIDRVIETNGKPSNVVSLKSGKVWLQAEADDDVNRLLIETFGSVMDTTEGAMFLEIEPGRRRACVDVFSGDASLRSLDNPKHASTLTKNQRTMLEPDKSEFDISGFESSFNKDNEQYSCIQPLKKKEPVIEIKVEEKEPPPDQPAAPRDITVVILGRTVIEFSGEEEKPGTTVEVVSFDDEEKEYYIIITGRATVTFEGGEQMSEGSQVVGFTETQFTPEEVVVSVSRQATVTFAAEEETESVVTDSEGTVVFTPESCAANGAGCASDLDCCSGICADGVCASEEREVSYTTLVVSAQGSISFKCQDAPVISGVKVGGVAASDGGAVEIEGGECETTKTVTAEWNVRNCGELKTGLTAKDSEGTAEKIEQGGSFTISADTAKVRIKATDDGGESTYSFNVKLKEHESVTAQPEITSLTYAGENIKDGDSVDVTIDSCEEGSFTMTGTAGSQCWEISSVSVTQDGESLSAGGFTEWTATTRVAAEEKQSSFVATVTDSRGVQSEAYNFDISFSVAPELLEPPAIEEVTYGDTTVYNGDTVSVPFDSCQAQQVTISGRASTPCGAIQEIKVTKGGESLYASGGGEWSAIDTLSPTDELSELSVTAVNSSGNSGEQFSFYIEPDASVSPPVVYLESVNNITIEDFFSVFNVNKSGLVGGKIIIRGTAEADTCEIDSAEVSLDDGGIWEEAEGAYSWYYEFTPADGTYMVTARATDIIGNTSDNSQTLEIEYSALTDEDIVFDAFDKLIQAYLDEDRSAFIDLTSPDFTSNYDSIEDVNQLENSLSDKFLANEYIYLRYDVDSTTVTGDTARVAFRWDSDPGSSGYSQYGVFQFMKEESEWMFFTVEDDNTFLRYTSVVDTITLSADDTDLVADDSSSTTITAEVRDSANNLIRDGTVIYFQLSPSNLGSITASAETFGGEATVTFSVGNEEGTAVITATSEDVTSDGLEIELYYEHAPCPPGVDCTE